MLGRRHDDLRRTLCDMATTAGLIDEEEPRGLPGFGQGGGDLLIHDLYPAQSIVADVCVVSEDVDALAETAASHAGHAAKVAERRKRQKYRPACDQLGIGFMPLAIENDGALGKELQVFIRRCNEVALGMPIAGTTWAASSIPLRHSGARGSPYASGEARRERHKGACWPTARQDREAAQQT